MTAFVGVDKGTTLTKAVVFDATTGKVLGLARQPTQSWHPQPGWHEEEMDGTWRNVATAIRDAIAQSKIPPAHIAGIGVSGHMAGLWTLDRTGAPMGRAIAWPDARALSVLNRWERNGLLTRVFRTWGNALMPGVPPALLAWMQEHQPEYFGRAAHVFCAKDFINYRLTGRIATDESDLSYFPVDIAARRLSEALFQDIGIAACQSLVPEVLPVGSLVGTVTQAAATATGLLAGTPVVTGAGDAVAAAVGTGALQAGQAVTVIGTSFMNCLTVDQAIVEPHGVGFLFMMPDNLWQKLMANTGGGSLCLDWVIQTFGAALFEGAAQDTVFEHIEHAVRALPALPGGLLLHPYLNTAGMSAPRRDPAARASLFGLSVETTPMEIIRSVMEGVALSMVDCYAALNAPVTDIRITGGGARSAVWRDICAAAMNRPLARLEAEETGALGVAMLAARAVGFYPDLAAAARAMVRIAGVTQPDPALHQRYAQAYPTPNPLNHSWKTPCHDPRRHLQTRAVRSGRHPHRQSRNRDSQLCNRVSRTPERPISAAADTERAGLRHAPFGTVPGRGRSTGRAACRRLPSGLPGLRAFGHAVSRCPRTGARPGCARSSSQPGDQ